MQLNPTKARSALLRHAMSARGDSSSPSRILSETLTLVAPAVPGPVLILILARSSLLLTLTGSGTRGLVLEPDEAKVFALCCQIL